MQAYSLLSQIIFIFQKVKVAEVAYDFSWPSMFFEGKVLLSDKGTDRISNSRDFHKNIKERYPAVPMWDILQPELVRGIKHIVRVHVMCRR